MRSPPDPAGFNGPVSVPAPPPAVLVTAAVEERSQFRIAGVHIARRMCAILSKLPRSPRTLSITRASFMQESFNLIDGSAAHQFPWAPLAQIAAGGSTPRVCSLHPLLAELAERTLLGRESCEDTSSEMTRMTLALRLVVIESRTPGVGDNSFNRVFLVFLSRRGDVSNPCFISRSESQVEQSENTHFQCCMDTCCVTLRSPNESEAGHDSRSWTPLPTTPPPVTAIILPRPAPSDYGCFKARPHLEPLPWRCTDILLLVPRARGHWATCSSESPSVHRIFPHTSQSYAFFFCESASPVSADSSA